ncbi:OmpA family protein [Rhodovulum sulfidophilum]|uniref:OmpA family protein n=1 Tax=Rhodovulum sulfidophilum TaxID=35806 RepID=UPI001F1AA36F|nr:OmpA family protein [Rhodovulum sulfidophilum]MCE8438222.1 OmpA family protein [Rhodovulum sulfidophilum]
MLRHPRKISQEEEAESVFVSMTDMTVGFLFIMILLLAFFASQYDDTETVPRPVYNSALDERDAALAEVERLKQQLEDLQDRIAELERLNTRKDARIAELEKKLAELQDRLKAKDPIELYNAQSARTRRTIIEALARAVKKDIDEEQIAGLDVSTQGDALRFQGTGLFASGQGTLSGASLRIIRQLGQHLSRELPCYSIGPRSDIRLDCNPGLVLIETVQVEGHTDSDGSETTNLQLSSQRALSAFAQIAPDTNGTGTPSMLDFRNLLDQPVMAVAGYGEMRPIADNGTVRGKAANRRIDLRFIMYVPPGKDLIPNTVSDISRISAALQAREAEQ